MSSNKQLNTQDYIEPEERPNHSERWTYTSIAFRSSRQKFRYFYLPQIALLVIIPLLCKWSLSEGNSQSDAVGMSMTLFAFYMWFCFFYWWPMLGAGWLSEVEDLFGPKTRASLWKQFRSGEIRATGINVPQTSKDVGEYDRSEYKKLLAVKDDRIDPT